MTALRSDTSSRESTEAATERKLGTVLVTGASSGLGEAIAQAVQRGGGLPICIDVNEARSDAPSALIDLAAPDAEARLRDTIEQCGGVNRAVDHQGSGRVMEQGVDAKRSHGMTPRTAIRNQARDRALTRVWARENQRWSVRLSGS